MKFKVGDRVRFMDSRPGKGSHEISGTIISYCADKEVLFKVHTEGCDFILSEDEITLDPRSKEEIAFQEVKDDCAILREECEQKDFATQDQSWKDTRDSRIAGLEGRVQELSSVHDENEILKQAIIQSLKVQSHYACVLNLYDGSQRPIFSSVKEWITHLKVIGLING
jgi:hypothetical protein